MSQENAALASRWFEEAWNSQRAELISELAADDCCGYAAIGDMINRDEFVRRTR